MRRLSLLLLALCSLLGSLGATSPASTLADSLFQRKDYVESSRAYEALIQAEGPTVARLFNLGNSYYQQGQLGRAILAYERAQLLDPRNKDLREVRDFAVRKTVDKLLSPEGWVRQLGDSIAYALPLSAWLVLCPLLLALSLAGWVVFALSSDPRLRRLTFYPALASLALSLVAGALIAHWLYAPQLAEQRVVILLPEVAVYAEPHESATPVTKLHEGSRLALRGQESGDYLRVELPDGQAGWIARRALERIAPLPH